MDKFTKSYDVKNLSPVKISWFNYTKPAIRIGGGCITLINNNTIKHSYIYFKIWILLINHYLLHCFEINELYFLIIVNFPYGFFLLTNLFVFPNSVFIHKSLIIYFNILFTHQSLCISKFCLLTNLSVFPNSVYFLSFQFTTG